MFLRVFDLKFFVAICFGGCKTQTTPQKSVYLLVFCLISFVSLFDFVLFLKFDTVEEKIAIKFYLFTRFCLFDYLNKQFFYKLS